MALLVFAGCADLLALSDTLSDLTDPLVVQATYIGVEAPPAGVSLDGTSWQDGSRAQAFLADAGGLDDLANAPIEDATVAMELDGEAVSMPSDAPGQFVATGAEGLGWGADVDATLVIERDGEHVLSLTTPAAPDVSIPIKQSRGSGVDIDLSGQPFDNVIVNVIRVEDGSTVFDSMPTDIGGLYRLTHSAGELTTEVPGETFDKPGVYLIGVMGLVNADPDTYDGVNLALSALTAGAMTFTAVTVQ